MSAIWYRFRTEARQRWRAWLALALVVGLAGGTVLASLAGARRTSSAYDRFLVAQDAWDVFLVSGIEGIFDLAVLDLEAIAELPQVAEAVPLVAMGAVARTPHGEAITADVTNFFASPGDRFGGQLNRRKLLEGRAADPTRADEVVVGFGLAERFRLGVGDVLATNFVDTEEAAAVFGGDAGTSMLPLLESEPLEELLVVGIAAAPGEFPPYTNTNFSSIGLTPAALAAHPDNLNVEMLAVTLHTGSAGVPAFLAEVDALTPAGSIVGAFPQQFWTAGVQGALDSLAGALTLSAALAGVVAALLVGQALVRQAGAEAHDEPTLVSIGLTGAQVGLLRLGKAGVIAATGALASAAIALALSPVFPIGLARVAEPEPGVHADALVLGLGAAAVLATTVALVAASAWLAHRRRPAAAAPAWARPSRLAAALAGLGAPVPVVAGTLLTSGHSRRRSGTTLGSAIAVLALGAGAVVATVTFAASLDRLVSTPALYGWTWDELVGSEFATAFDDDEVAFVETAPEVASAAVATTVGVTVEEERAFLWGAEVVKGALTPALLSGRPPLAADEVVLAPHVAEGVEIGDAVGVALAGREERYELVGRAVVPLNDGFATLEGVQRLSPGQPPQVALVSFAAGADRSAFRERAAAALALDENDFLPPSLPVDVANFGGADGVLAVMGTLMAAVAVATLAHTVSLATRHRRHDLSVLRVLGFTRRQGLATVACQALVLVVTAMVVAVPLGIAAGRVAWLAFAGHVGVVPSPVVPWLATLVVTAASLAVAQLAAAAPAWRAARVSPADALRAE